MSETNERLYERLLVLRCQAGDETAFAEIVERYRSRLRYYLRKLLREIHDPDSVLQDVWFDVFRAVPRLADVGAFRAWLYRIARDRALRELRKRRLKYEPLDESQLNDTRTAEEVTFAWESAESFHAALDQLTPAHRDVLVLRYLENMDYEEIARVVGCEMGTVRSRLHYAKQALRTVLERIDDHERQRT